MFLQIESSIESYVNSMVSVITVDGRTFAGTLSATKPSSSLTIPTNGVDSPTSGVEQVVLGLQIVRSDNIAVIGELDEKLEQRLDFSNIKADPIMSIIK